MADVSYLTEKLNRHIVSVQPLIIIPCCTSIAPSPADVDKDDENETVVENLKVVEGLEAVANEDDYPSGKEDVAEQTCKCG